MPQAEVRGISNGKLPMSKVKSIVWFSIVCQCIMYVSGSVSSIAFLKFELTRLVSCIDAAFRLEKNDFEYTWSSKALPKHPCSQGRVGFMTKGLSLASTWNQDAAGTRPWASLLPSYSLKMTIVKPWFELHGGRTPSLPVLLAVVGTTCWIPTGTSAIPGITVWWVRNYHKHTSG